jgi:hypothetical protein
MSSNKIGIKRGYYCLICDFAGFLPSKIKGWDRLISVLIDGIDKAIDTMPQRYQQTIREYYGLNDGRQKTLNETAAVIDKSLRTARKHIGGGIRCLRHPYRRKIMFGECTPF